jgi:hypothetical protein
METKICSKCNEEKEVCEFYKNKDRFDGKRPECKVCSNKQSILYNQKNKEKVDKIKQKYVDNNKEKVKKSKKDWFNKNPNYQNEWVHIKSNTDVLFKLKKNMRSRLWLFVKNRNVTKKNKTFDIVGCSPQFLKEYLQNQFTKEMSWDNHGLFGWHIDHIIPLSSANTEEEMYELCHYTNLQPLWAGDNLKKGSKLI